MNAPVCSSNNKHTGRPPTVLYLHSSDCITISVHQCTEHSQACRIVELLPEVNAPVSFPKNEGTHWSATYLNKFLQTVPSVSMHVAMFADLQNSTAALLTVCQQWMYTSSLLVWTPSMSKQVCSLQVTKSLNIRLRKFHTQAVYMCTLLNCSWCIYVYICWCRF